MEREDSEINESAAENLMYDLIQHGKENLHLGGEQKWLVLCYKNVICS